MNCSCCAFGDTADQHFDAEKVAKELRHYRRKGPRPTTRGLRDGFVSIGLRQGTVLDIGGGLGILSLELLDAGFSRAVVVDASSAYLAAASEEAVRRGRSASTEVVQGDFVAVASQLTPATAVTLDRVVCCYPFYERLLEQALRLAEHSIALSYPRDRWFVRLGIWLECTPPSAWESVSNVRPSPIGNDADNRAGGLHTREPPLHAVVVV